MTFKRVAGPGQESVWNYPRPPRLEACSKLLRVDALGTMIARSRQSHRVLETSHPPVYYIDPEDVRLDLLVPRGDRSWCEWKGNAHYFDIRVGDQTLEKAAWAYRDPQKPFEAIHEHIAFYAQIMDACYVDGERVQPQPGGFYGGWITSEIVGPFKGDPGTLGW